jgi:hypothetical protein
MLMPCLNLGADLKHSVALKIRLLHSRQFTNNNFHFRITPKSAASQVLLQGGGEVTTTPRVPDVLCGVAQ